MAGMELRGLEKGEVVGGGPCQDGRSGESGVKTVEWVGLGRGSMSMGCGRE